ncbi:hypothetical protein B0T26DRAFT_770285 [Lasiosphaeria miniovina]|uniref:Uncharacterized protein n=1 Tax=Lasiosphaeria miniovina TaxID=1954250 RepID=A0AA40E211_9PEZI|nr:uncharacterized protein B0T26DRAFT_770285 [Lasiosphaeria miniovina]KAK0722077.1 hypothetical protein B0T26DRAFT_770285 [Lasiosphaeria miniovina]
MKHAQGPPYLPQTAQLGGVPTVGLDVPISAVLLVLFVAGAATNMTIFQFNRRHNYKFLFSGLLFGFCMARIAALAMRMVWAGRPRDINVAIASQIFTAAGVLLLFVTNLVFAQRMVRAYHPFFGWQRGVTLLFVGLYASVVAVLVMVISVTVQSFFTLDPATRRTDRTVQLFSATYLAAMAFLPVPLVALAALLPRRTRIDKFGEGHFSTKLALLTFTATLLAAGAVFRAATAYASRPLDDPAWFQSKACYYCFNFVIELVVVYTYALSRFDRRFHVPDGSSAPGHYSCAEFGPDAAAALALTCASSPSSHAGVDVEPFDKHSATYVYSKRSSAWSAQSRRSVRSGGLAGESGAAVAAEAHSETCSISRDADMAWMARAMRELYGEDETDQLRGPGSAHR